MMLCAVLAAGCGGGTDAPSTSGNGSPTSDSHVTVTTSDGGSDRIVALWPMDDKSASEMRDVSGNGHVGVVGASVERTSDHYAFSKAIDSVVDSSRLVTVADSPDFDIARSDFSISVRIRTSSTGEHNIIQKGQSQVAGGFWKVEVNANGGTPGIPHCEFKGSRSAIGVASKVRIDDGEWHLLSCEWTPDGVQIVVDGTTKEKEGETGPIANSAEIFIGGKAECNPSNDVECDYFEGDLADVRIEVG